MTWSRYETKRRKDIMANRDKLIAEGVDVKRWGADPGHCDLS
jgi:hypothetical protein